MHPATAVTAAGTMQEQKPPNTFCERHAHPVSCHSCCGRISTAGAFWPSSSSFSQYRGAVCSTCHCALSTTLISISDLVSRRPADVQVFCHIARPKTLVLFRTPQYSVPEYRVRDCWRWLSISATRVSYPSALRDGTSLHCIHSPQPAVMSNLGLLRAGCFLLQAIHKSASGNRPRRGGAEPQKTRLAKAFWGHLQPPAGAGRAQGKS